MTLQTRAVRQATGAQCHEMVWLVDGLRMLSGAVLEHSLPITIAQARATGDSPWGPPATALLDPVPTEDLIRAGTDGIPSLLRGLEGDERNVLLTLARVWVTSATGQVLAKDEATAGRQGGCRIGSVGRWSRLAGCIAPARTTRRPGRRGYWSRCRPPSRRSASGSRRSRDRYRPRAAQHCRTTRPSSHTGSVVSRT